MTSVAEITLIGRLVQRLEKIGSWCGETHIQKTAYVAKVTRNVPLASEFILYKHGPYSFDLSNTLTNMRAQHILSATSQGGYGSSYHLNDRMWSVASKSSGEVYSKYDEDINFVCDKLGKKGVADLERIATAVFVTVNFPGLSKANKADKLHQLKPHIELSSAKVAFEEASVFI